MTPEEKSLLERTHRLAEENNSILRSMRRTSRFAFIARLIYWAVIILLGFGAYYFIQPYINSLLSLVGNGEGGVQGVMDALGQANSAASQLKDMYNSK